MGLIRANQLGTERFRKMSEIIWLAVGVAWIAIAVGIQWHREHMAERDLNDAMKRGDWDTVDRALRPERYPE